MATTGIRVKTFGHQLGTTEIRIYPDGTATFRRKRYSSYRGARRALTNYCGFSWLIKG